MIQQFIVFILLSMLTLCGIVLSILLIMGLVQECKELRIKRTRKPW